MKTITQIFIAVILFAATNFSMAQPSQEEQKAWMDYMTPGPVHEMLARSNGEWNADITMWMSPDAPPSKSTGSVVNSMILGGRYQQSTHKGEMMGMPFEGVNTIAYDNAKKMLISTWVDNMGTGVMYMQGTWDAATKTATLAGTQIDPMTGQDMPVREVFKIIDDKTQMFEMYMTKDGKESKVMEIMYTKK